MTTYSDTFTGDGALNGHAADSGFGTWTLLPAGWAIPDGLTISGGVIVAPTSDERGNTTGANLPVTSSGFEIALEFKGNSVERFNDACGVSLADEEGGGWYASLSQLHATEYGDPSAYFSWSFYFYHVDFGAFSCTFAAEMFSYTDWFRFGLRFNADGTVQLFKEPAGGGTRTYITSGYTDPWLTTPVALDLHWSPATDPATKLSMTAYDYTTGGLWLDNLGALALTPPADPTTSTVAISTDYSDSGGGKFYIGRATTLTLTAKDANGDPVGAGGETVVIDHAGGTSDLTISAVTDVGDGTYTATPTALTAGTSTAVTVTIGGVTVTTTMPSFTVLATPTVTGRGALALRGGALAYADSATVSKWAQARQYALRFALGGSGRWQRFAVVHGATASVTTSDVNYFALYALLVKAMPTKQRTDTF